MPQTYNSIAGQSVHRLAGLSDGVFAIAMTLLVLDLRAPAAEPVHSEHDLWLALSALSPRLLVHVMVFMTLGIFWVGQQTQLNQLARSTRGLTWIHILFLFAVSITPFSTALLEDFIAFRLALLVYWANVLLLGTVLYISWTCATRGGLVKEDVPPAVCSAIQRRIVIAQAFYAFGALLCIINTYWSISFIVLVELYYAVAPRLPRRGGK